MHRRTVLSLAAGAAVTAAATTAQAGDAGGSAPATVNLSGVALPVIAGGRLRNYVFVTVRLHLGSGANQQQVRAKEPFFRDALVRAGHRTPFTVADDLTRLNERALSASLMSAATTIAGRGAVARVEVVSQAPRRRTGL